MNQFNDFAHVSVLTHEVRSFLFVDKQNHEPLSLKKKHANFWAPGFPKDRPLVWVDCTLGLGGHSLAFLDFFLKHPDFQFSPGCCAIFIDQDAQAIEQAQKKIQSFLDEQPPDYRQKIQLYFTQSNFCNLKQIVSQVQSDCKIDLLLADLGVSSPQIDTPSRGFSVTQDGPLDMRMNALEGQTAWDILCTYPEDQLAQLFFKFAEEPRSRKLAKAVVTDRSTGKLANSTKNFAAFCERVLGYGRSRSSPAYRIFQALRIEVNQELASLETLMSTLPHLTHKGARCGFLTFHSLEDALVKKQMRLWEKTPETWHTHEEPHALPSPNHRRLFNEDLREQKGEGFGLEIPRGGVVASETERNQNSRARSARLRVFCFAR